MGNCSWWIRSLITDEYYQVAYVHDDGGILDDKSFSFVSTFNMDDTHENSVRPAVWVDLGS